MSAPLYKVHVRQGQVHVNSVSVLCATEHALVFMADTRAKYPALFGIHGSGFHVGASENTLFAEDTDDLTEVRFDLPEGDWYNLTETGRYSITIGFYKHTPDSTILWVDDDK